MRARAAARNSSAEAARENSGPGGVPGAWPAAGVAARTGADGVVDGLNRAWALRCSARIAPSKVKPSAVNRPAAALLPSPTAAARTMAPSRLLSCRRSGLEDAQQIGIGGKRRLALGAHVLQQPAQVGGNIGPETREIDIGRLQHDGSFAVLGQRQQQMLKRYQPMRLLAREPACALQALAQLPGDGKGFELVRKGLRHHSLPNGC